MVKAILEDLNATKVLLNNNKYYASAFYSHQAAEKCLEALLLYFGKDVKTHDLSKMLYYNTFSKNF